MTLKSQIKLLLAGLAGAWILACASGPSVAAEIENDTCLQCHSDKTLTKTNKAGKEISLFVDPAVLKASAHKSKSCTACHTDITGNHPDDAVPAKPVDCRRCHESESATFEASIHGIELKKGNASAPTCIDCHGRHNVLPPTSPLSPLHFSNLAKTCGGCHGQESEDVQASVHGKAVAKGERESATCIDCHNDHQIEGLKGASSYKISVEICSKCHASAPINARFGMPADRVLTFRGSYHGLAGLGRSTSAANCASCHGYHKILPSSDPASSINNNNLGATCGKCHPGATENFTISKVHTDDISGGDTSAIVSRWVRRFYLGAIFAVIGLLSLHNLLAWLRCAKIARRARGSLVVRMNHNQRLQHFLLLSSFTILALSGFALKYPDSWLAWIFCTESIRRWIHRGAGVVMIALGIYHLFYIAFSSDGRRLVRDFLPRLRDAKDFVANLRYFIGSNARKPEFGRFGYPEKIEYWAVVWGIVIMSATGLMIWLKIDVTQFLPRWVVEVAVTVHFYEAILACLAIVVWHLYHVIFSPDIYPMNWAWWDGKVEEHWQREEHPLDQSPSHPEHGSSPADRPDKNPRA